MSTLQSSSHTLQSLTDYAYYLPADASTDRPILGVVHGTRYTLLIDGGNSLAHAQLLQDALENATLPHPDFLTLTHSHWDHIFGAVAWGAPLLAEKRVAENLQAQQQLEWHDEALEARVQDGTEIPFCRDMIHAELPDNNRRVTIRTADIVFDNKLTLDLGGITCELVHVGGEHAPDSVVVYAYASDERTGGVLFLGDCTYHNLYNRQADGSYDMQALQKLLKNLAAFPASHYLASHDDTPQDVYAFRQAMEYLSAIGMTVEAHGFDGDLVLEMLSRRYGMRPDDDVRSTVRSFQLGLRLRKDAERKAKSDGSASTNSHTG
jgi:glyoxylase-like metal-dependent hydrolase (beta-lactamase superfamily II)